MRAGDDEEDGLLREPPEFATFYKATAQNLMTMLQLLGASRDDAAEATQETMIKVLLNWHAIEACKRRAWCRTTATRAYYELRGRSREQLSGDLDRLGASLVSPRDHCRETEEFDAVRRLLETLPERRRQVLTWHLIGATHAEIAEELKITESTVRTHIQLGLADLTGVIVSAGEDRR